MSNDTISKDPKMQEEARKVASNVAANAAMPKPAFDPIAVAREEFAKRVDLKYAPVDKSGFDDVWPLLTRPFDPPPAESDILFMLTEHEFRMFVGSLFRRINALNLQAFAAMEEEKSSAVHKSALVEIEERLGPTSQTKIAEGIPDVTRGFMRKTSSIKLMQQGTCPLHPTGCPDMGMGGFPGIEVTPGSDNPIGQALKNALEKLSRRK